jgi:hypothetical protein
MVSAVRALRYSFSQQQLPDDSEAPYIGDPATHWGFWSWDPPYDYTMSADQSTHHARAYWFFLDYFASLTADQRQAVADLCEEQESTEPADSTRQA